MIIINNYELTNEADTDLENIFEYTEKSHNQDQGILYLSNIENVFFQLSKQPNLGRLRNDIKEDIFSFPIQKHIIFYVIGTHKLIIIRVLHSSRDMPKHFKNK